MQTKQFPEFGLEIKALGDREFEGYGSVFGNVDDGGDAVMPGAFRKSLQNRRDGALPLMFWMHDPTKVPGVWTEMREDARGLYVRGTLADTPLGNEMRELLKIKAVRGLSIGYQVDDSNFKDDVRQLTDLDLWEVSIVSMAMNPLAQVAGVKSRLSEAGEYVPTEREFEHLMRKHGCSKKTARALTARVFDVDAGGMPVDPPVGSRDVDSEVAEFLRMLSEEKERAEARALAAALRS